MAVKDPGPEAGSGPNVPDMPAGRRKTSELFRQNNALRISKWSGILGLNPAGS